MPDASQMRQQHRAAPHYVSELAFELLCNQAGRQQDCQLHTRPQHVGIQEFPQPSNAGII